MKKHLLALATGLLLGTTAATAQLHNWDNLPTLEEWPLEPYMRQALLFVPLPDFELPEGKNAVMIVPGGAPWITRYLRNPGDSANQFNWNHPGTGVPRRVDLNGDGNMDYLAGENIYYGRGEGLQPSPEPVRVGEHKFTGSFVDVNNDGYMDAVSGRHVILGAKNFLENREVPIALDSSMIRRYIDTKFFYYTCWRSTDGIVRYAASYEDSVTKEPVRQSLCLYRLRVEGDIVRMELEQEIRSEGFSNLVSGVSPFQPEGTNGREFVFLQRGDNPNRTELYAMEHGKLVLKGSINLQGIIQPLQMSVDGDNTTDYLYIDLGRTIVYSGAALPELRPIFLLPQQARINIQTLGDINNDGFNDIGYLTAVPPREFHVVLGREQITGITDEQLVRQNKLYPNPADSIISLHALLQRGGKYTILLYNISGERIAELRSGMYAEGEIVEQFDLRPLGLAPGAYILRLTGNGTFKDMKFLVPR